MTPMVWIGVAVVVFILAWVFVVAPRQKDQTPREPVLPDWEAMRDEQVQAALARNNKIEAIKRYRLLTGLGLKEAKDAIDYALAHPGEAGDKKKKAAYDAQDAGIRDLVEEGRIDEAVEVYRKFAGVDEYTAKDAVTVIEQQLKLGDSLETMDNDERIRALMKAGNKLEAIRLYRAATGAGLQEAKTAVEALGRKPG